jgi:hypothetical protein
MNHQCRCSAPGAPSWYADDPRPGWPFPFPDLDPPPIPEERLFADLEALRRALDVRR